MLQYPIPSFSLIAECGSPHLAMPSPEMRHARRNAAAEFLWFLIVVAQHVHTSWQREAIRCNLAEFLYAVKCPAGYIFQSVTFFFGVKV